MDVWSQGKEIGNWCRRWVFASSRTKRFLELLMRFHWRIHQKYEESYIYIFMYKLISHDMNMNEIWFRSEQNLHLIIPCHTLSYLTSIYLASYNTYFSTYLAIWEYAFYFFNGAYLANLRFSILGIKLAGPVISSAWQCSQPIFTLSISLALGWEAPTWRKMIGIWGQKSFPNLFFPVMISDGPV